jgi:hypothetical protein
MIIFLTYYATYCTMMFCKESFKLSFDMLIMIGENWLK